MLLSAKNENFIVDDGVGECGRRWCADNCHHRMRVTWNNLWSMNYYMKLLMPTSDSKHVQTELDSNEYERLRRFAEERGLSIKEAVHEALVAWIERQQQPDATDPAFTVLEDLDAAGLPETAATDASTEGDLVDEWDGDDAQFELASEPSPDTEA